MNETPQALRKLLNSVDAAVQPETTAPVRPKRNSVLAVESERPYSIQDLTVLHNLSYRTIVRLYENEPDVLILHSARAQQRGRRFRTIRVPHHVYRRVKHRMEVR